LFGNCQDVASRRSDSVRGKFVRLPFTSLRKQPGTGENTTLSPQLIINECIWLSAPSFYSDCT